jgi:DGQHR domain-containing protein
MEIPPDPDKVEISFDCIRATQPIGDLYIGAVGFRDLVKFTYFDVRRVVSEERDVEKYLGIQRPISKKRLHDLQAYVNYSDATFPSSVIVAINDASYASYDNQKKRLTIRNFRLDEASPSIAIRQIGRVIDGQHRIAGLEAFAGEKFDVAVTVFVEADIADQGHIFSTVNLEQTKVHKNLVYDLYELARSRSPQKTCHLVAVTLDKDDQSPLHQRIKRLGFATEGRIFEPVGQATFVEGLMAHITNDSKADRDALLRGNPLSQLGGDDVFKLPLRNMFIEGRDLDIIQVVDNFFQAVRDRWPQAWDARGRGFVLNRANGVKALLRFFRHAYLKVGIPGDVPTREKFLANVFTPIAIQDKDFTVENFVPGSSGEARMVNVFRGKEVL